MNVAAAHSLTLALRLKHRLATIDARPPQLAVGGVGAIAQVVVAGAPQVGHDGAGRCVCWMEHLGEVSDKVR